MWHIPNLNFNYPTLRALRAIFKTFFLELKLINNPIHLGDYFIDYFLSHQTCKIYLLHKK